jgi:hypothetical protein
MPTDRLAAVLAAGQRRRPVATGAPDAPGSVESTDPLFDAVFAVPELRDKILGNGDFLEPEFKGVDPYGVCDRARRWAHLHPANMRAARNKPGAWMRLVYGVFGHEFLQPAIANGLFPDLPANPGPYPDYWQQLFFKLCQRYMAYREGTRVPGAFGPNEMMYAPFAMAAVIFNGMAIVHVPHELRMEELCMAAVRSNRNAFDMVPFELHSRKLMEFVISGRKENERFFQQIGNARVAFEMALERPELLQYGDLYNLSHEEQDHVLRAVLMLDGSAFRYLGAHVMRRSPWYQLAINSYPWASEFLKVGAEDVHERSGGSEDRIARDFSLANMLPQQRALHHYVKNVLRHRPLDLQYASEELRNDVKIASTAVRVDRAALEYVRDDAFNNPQFAAAFIRKYGRQYYAAVRSARAAARGE